jgi:hypothetical protein
MPIDPNIPLSVQQSKFGEIIYKGVQDYTANKRAKEASDRANALLTLKQEEAAQKMKDIERKSIHSQTATFLRNEVLPLYAQGDVQGAEAKMKDELLRIGLDKKESIPIEDLYNIHTQDPQKAGLMAKSFVDQAVFEKLIPQTGKDTKTALEEAQLRKTEKQIQKIDVEIKEKVDKAKTAKEKEAALRQGQIQKADIVIGKVDKALDQTGFFTTGATGAVSGKIPGSPAFNLEKTIDTIKANIGFNELQQMRASSPTGGALGQVAVRELEFLQSAISSLDKGQEQSQLRENLEQVKTHYQNWKDTLEGKVPQTKPPSGESDGWSIKRID